MAEICLRRRTAITDAAGAHALEYLADESIAGGFNGPQRISLSVRNCGTESNAVCA